MGIKENIKLLREKYKLSQKIWPLSRELRIRLFLHGKVVQKNREWVPFKNSRSFWIKKSNLIEDNGLTEKQGYYIDPEAAKMAQELYENPGMRILFDAAKNVSPEDLKVAAELISRMKKKEEYEE